jgi:hypothetical protein
LNLTVEQPIESGTFLWVQILVQNAPGPILVRVIHSREKPDGSWSLGCAFARELSESDLRTIRAKRQRPCPSDKRVWLRFPCSLATSYLTDDHAAPLSAKIINSSAGGLGLLVDREIPQGSLLNVELPRPQGRAARSVLVRVVHVRGKPGGYWILGCAFAKELAAAELLAVLGRPAESCVPC